MKWIILCNMMKIENINDNVVMINIIILVILLNE